jgi:DNA-binding Xre family transcriptional regulator
MNKTKLAKTMGISRPTLNKRIKDGKLGAVSLVIDNETMQKSIKLIALMDCKPSQIDSILEFLGDNKMLNDTGVKFATDFWKLFIKE